MVDCRVIHSGDNRSRHSPIILKLNLGNLPVRSEIKSKKIRRPAWSRVTQQEAAKYTEALDSRLQALHLPASMKCSDPCCKDSTHSEERDSFVLDILCQLVECSHTVLPLTGGRDRGGGTRGNPIPGWKEEAEPQRERSIYWHNVWMKEGRPSQGWLHDTMVKTRTQFHHAVRRLKARCKEVKAKKLFEASVHGEQSLMSEMKKIRHGGTGGPAELPENVAGANGEDEIVDKFKEVYSVLYNSAGSEDEMKGLLKRVEALIARDSLSAKHSVSKVTASVVKEACCKMKPRKGDVSGGFTSDALLNAPNILFEQLAVVFQSWLLHGTVTPSLLACAFLPLLKSPMKDPADTKSYRAIAGSSLILKLF